mmetsp:Transcript_13732/g.31745  ORF Transcript_13732/g.31745 Transcript_13732/m.31745 type:complete len:295 (+) Transcript_13732:3068-3952(+)
MRSVNAWMLVRILSASRSWMGLIPSLAAGAAFLTSAQRSSWSTRSFSERSMLRPFLPSMATASRSTSNWRSVMGICTLMSYIAWMHLSRHWNCFSSPCSLAGSSLRSRSTPLRNLSKSRSSCWIRTPMRGKNWLPSIFLPNSRTRTSSHCERDDAMEMSFLPCTIAATTFWPSHLPSVAYMSFQVQVSESRTHKSSRSSPSAPTPPYMYTLPSMTDTTGLVRGGGRGPVMVGRFQVTALFLSMAATTTSEVTGEALPPTTKALPSMKRQAPSLRAPGRSVSLRERSAARLEAAV